jgi:hypothetical protein
MRLSIVLLHRLNLANLVTAMLAFEHVKLWWGEARDGLGCWW